MKKREIQRANSNNCSNPNKNVCALAVANALGVANEVRYLHEIGDIKRAAATRFNVRSRKSALKGSTVGAIRKHCTAQKACGFIVYVAGHVILLDAWGNTWVDTDPRKNDRRKVLGVWALFDKQAARYAAAVDRAVIELGLRVDSRTGGVIK